MKKIYVGLIMLFHVISVYSSNALIGRNSDAELCMLSKKRVSIEQETVSDQRFSDMITLFVSDVYTEQPVIEKKHLDPINFLFGNGNSVVEEIGIKEEVDKPLGDYIGVHFDKRTAEWVEVLSNVQCPRVPLLFTQWCDKGLSFEHVKKIVIKLIRDKVIVNGRLTLDDDC